MNKDKIASKYSRLSENDPHRYEIGEYGQEPLLTQIQLRRKFKIVENWCRKNDIEGKRVLDIGCASGSYSFLFSGSAEEVIGVDTSKNFIQIAGKKAEDKDVKNIQFLNQDIFESEFDADSFDIICCIELLHHLKDSEQRELLERINSWIKDQGILITDIKNSFNPVIRYRYKKATSEELLLRTMSPIKFRNLLTDFNFSNINFKPLFHTSHWIEHFSLVFCKNDKEIE